MSTPTEPAHNDTGAVAPAPAGRAMAWWRRPAWSGPLILLALTLLMFGDVLFASSPLSASAEGGDSWTSWYNRVLAFGNLRHGHIVLWNPYIMSGNPYFGDFQTTIFYPPNWQYMLLPIARALNIEWALHILLAGLGMYWWGLRRRLHPIAALTGAAAFCFGGPLMLQLFAGHGSSTTVACWIPLIYCCADEIGKKPTMRWVLAGIAVVAMQILAGFPQYVFYTGLAVALLALLDWRVLQRRWVSFGALAAMYTGGAALAAVQLLTTLDATHEASRSHVTYRFATSVSLPPENLWTLLTPGMFGNAVTFEYWGRFQPWEVTLYMGVGMLALAVWSLLGAAPEQRCFARKLAVVYAMLMVMALGSFTPLFRPLYDHVPGFGQFRVPARFAMPAAVLLAMLAGVGLDGLLRECSGARRLARWVGAAGVALCLSGLLIYWSGHGGQPGLWATVLSRMGATHATYRGAAHYHAASFIAASSSATLGALLLSGFIALIFGAVLSRALPRGRDVKTTALLATLAIGEIFVYSRIVMTHFDLRTTLPPVAHRALQAHPGDYRYIRFYSQEDNSAMGMHSYDMWGYESFRLRRYAEFMYWSQGWNPDELGYEYNFYKINPLWKMLRCRYVFIEGKHATQVREQTGYLPHLLLLHNWKQINGRDAIFKYMESGRFDPWLQVILEQRPNPLPVAGAFVGSARIVASGTDEMTIEADVPRPEILLITDSYASGWHAVGLPGSVARHYDVLPANYILRAIPLCAGRHRIRLYYLPAGFVRGAWVSGIALLLYCLALGLVLWRRWT